MIEKSTKIGEPSDFYVSGKEPTKKDYEPISLLATYKPILKAKINSEESHLDQSQIHWRNTPLLTRYMTPHSTIKSHKLTGLDKQSQNKVAKVIRQARSLNVLPSYQFLRSFHKKPLKSLDEDFDQEEQIVVDIRSGTISRNLEEFYDDKFDYKRSHYPSNYQQVQREDLIKDSFETQQIQEMIQDA